MCKEHRHTHGPSGAVDSATTQRELVPHVPSPQWLAISATCMTYLRWYGKRSCESQQVFLNAGRRLSCVRVVHKHRSVCGETAVNTYLLENGSHTICPPQLLTLDPLWPYPLMSLAGRSARTEQLEPRQAASQTHAPARHCPFS